MKRLFSVFILLTFFFTSSRAVLNERDIAQSLSVLRVELRQAYLQQKQSMVRWKQMNEAQHNQMLRTMQRSSQASLMIYSQKDDYVFDLTYACHEAQQQYYDFKKNRMPYDRISKKMQTELDRYDGLIRTLEVLPPAVNGRIAKADTARQRHLKINKDTLQKFLLSPEAQKDRNECIFYAKALRNNIMRFSAQIAQDSVNYQRLEAHLKSLHDYAQLRYRDIQQNIFQNAGVSYPTLLARLPFYWKYAKKDAHDKYSSSNEYRGVRSEWRGPVVWGYVMFVVSYLILSIILTFVIITFLMRKVKRFQKPEMQERRIPLMMACGVLLFALSIMVASIFLTHNFFVMATGLLVEYAWLLTAIFVSLLIRLKGNQVKDGFKVYTPIVLMGLIIIIFRIVFIPNALVNIIFPPVVLLFTIWQWRTTRSNSSDIPRSDRYYTWISLFVMVASCIFAWVGFTLLAVEIFIWWIFQLTAIQTITLAFNLLDIYEERKLKTNILASGISEEEMEKGISHGHYITKTWFYDLVHMALVPIAAAYSVLLCIYLAADVFDLAATCITIFMTPFLDVEGVIQLSLFKMVVVAALFFVFRYLCYVSKALYRHMRLEAFFRKTGDRLVRRNEINLTLGYNIITIVVWGIYIISAIVLLKIPKSGISIVTAGLATGIGFAMKDILNNFFYGIQLMAGRLRVGDYIECDGVQGKVESITYQSTQIITLDDCVMAFLNSTLFAKNFKNLTRNHSYELIKIPVGVAYGTNVEKVRSLIVEEVMNLQRTDKYERELIDPARGVQVLFNDFGESSVDLLVVAWVLVSEKVGYKSRAKEAIYNVLNKNGIEIPFPQRDLHMIEKK
ncbi:MAG: mechanosensitive ion channel family protein [Alloprevotella sp.]|nr:mechanosensitive ion channel family protein [Alloprevotella sp.]